MKRYLVASASRRMEFWRVGGFSRKERARPAPNDVPHHLLRTGCLTPWPFARIRCGKLAVCLSLDGALSKCVSVQVCKSTISSINVQSHWILVLTAGYWPLAHLHTCTLRAGSGRAPETAEPAVLNARDIGCPFQLSVKSTDGKEVTHGFARAYGPHG